MTLVTIHLSPGQTPKELIRAIRELNGDTAVRTTSGRFGVLVDAEIARQYLQARFGPTPPPAPPEPEPVPAPEVAEQKPRVRAARTAKTKAAKAAADKSEGV